MKKNVLFVAIIAVLSLAAIAMAAEPVVKVRVVNVDVLGDDAVTSAEALAKTATMSIAENAKVFPAIESMVLTAGKNKATYVPDVTLPAGALSFSGTIDEAQPIEFISIANFEGAGKFDGALVSRDGTVTYIDDEIVIDYKERSIATPKSLVVKDGDVLLLFTKNTEPITFGHETGVVDYGNPYDNNDRQTHEGGRITGKP